MFGSWLECLFCSLHYFFLQVLVIVQPWFPLHLNVTEYNIKVFAPGCVIVIVFSNGPWLVRPSSSLSSSTSSSSSLTSCSIQIVSLGSFRVSLRSMAVMIIRVIVTNRDNNNKRYHYTYHCPLQSDPAVKSTLTWSRYGQIVSENVSTEMPASCYSYLFLSILIYSYLGVLATNQSTGQCLTITWMWKILIACGRLCVCLLSCFCFVLFCFALFILFWSL